MINKIKILSIYLCIGFLCGNVTAQTDSSKIQTIKDNFKTINQTTNWTKTEAIKLEETTEGGEMLVYYDKAEIRKLTINEFGEMFKQIREYYLLNNKLSFAYYKLYKYNRPITWDSIAMKENKDDQVWDFNKSTLKEQRFYFDNSEMLQWINENNLKENKSTLPFKDKAIEVMKEFNRLMKKIK
ncbi:MAG: hypothetical protein NTU73_08090 [Ignavibacteriae bacterium]|nr:hypothetical protein [Ignavibacteriota bacterium]